MFCRNLRRRQRCLYVIGGLVCAACVSLWYRAGGQPEEDRSQHAANTDETSQTIPMYVELDNLWQLIIRTKNPLEKNLIKSTGELNEALDRLVAIHASNGSDGLMYLASEVRARREVERSREIATHLLPPDELEFLVKTMRHLPIRSKRWTRAREYLIARPDSNSTPKAWQRFQYGIHRDALYDDDNVDIVWQHLRDLQLVPIEVLTEMPEKGTQLKFLYELEDGSHALFKPMRVRRNYEVPLDTYYFYEYERHHAEIAAFHLDRLLGFHRVPPVAGRKVDMVRDIFNLGGSKLQDTFFRSPANSLCLYGRCDYFCDRRHSICGDGQQLEGSIASFLPPELHLKSVRSPWRRSYSVSTPLAEWQLYPASYCDKVKARPEFGKGRRLLDIVDLHIFDFLTGNQDRHHVSQFADPNNDTFLVAFDNGRAFGRPHFDDEWILAPLSQCCIVRASTVQQLLSFETGPKPLSLLMREALRSVPLEPILTESQLRSLDRRVKRTLRAIYACVQANGYNVSNVIKDDGL